MSKRPLIMQKKISTDGVEYLLLNPSVFLQFTYYFLLPNNPVADFILK